MTKRMPDKDPRYPGPTRKDWLLVAVGLGFVAMGFFILPREPTKAAACIVFFGFCAALGIANVVRKLRHARLRPLSVEIVGGVPLRPSRGYAALLGASVCAVGVALLPAALGGPTALLVCTLVILLAGAALLGGVALGKLPVGFLRFDEQGLTVGARSDSFTAEWDNILGAWPGEFHDNAALFLMVRDLDALVVQPPQAKQRVVRRLVTNAEWVGAHVMVTTASYGIDLPLLVAAIENYIRDPNARAGLAVPRLPAAPEDPAQSRG